MPMGLKGVPATFQRLMDFVLRGLHWKSVLVYLDDIILFSQTFAEHLEHLREVFHCLRQAGLKLKPSKSIFVRPEVLFLGHVVSAEGVQTDPKKTETISTSPHPTSIAEVRSFLGLTGYYRRFVKNYAAIAIAIASPLSDLTGKRKQFVWGDEQELAFERLKEVLSSPSVLAYPNFTGEHPFCLKTDASDTAIGAIVTQVQDGKERVIAYGSRKLNSAEQLYAVTDREALPVVWGMIHFKPYLYGRRFLVLTDHQPITNLKTMKDPRGKFARRLQEVSSFDFGINYRPGKMHQDADCLSRRPSTNIPDLEPETISAATIIGDIQSFKEGQATDPNIRCCLINSKTGSAHHFGVNGDLEFSVHIVEVQAPLQQYSQDSVVICS